MAERGVQRKATGNENDKCYRVTSQDIGEVSALQCSSAQDEADGRLYFSMLLMLLEREREIPVSSDLLKRHRCICHIFSIL